GTHERVSLLDEGEARPGLRLRYRVHRRRGEDVPDDELGPDRRGGGGAVPGRGDTGPGGRGDARLGGVRGRASRGPPAAADATGAGGVRGRDRAAALRENGPGEPAGG